MSFESLSINTLEDILKYIDYSDIIDYLKQQYKFDRTEENLNLLLDVMDLKDLQSAIKNNELCYYTELFRSDCRKLRRLIFQDKLIRHQ